MKSLFSWLVIGILILTLLASPASAKRYSNTVFASVGWSEWCAPGFVLVDLDSGVFEWTAQNERRQCAASETRKVVGGKLTADELATLRKSVDETRTTGLVPPECRAGRKPGNVVVSNAKGPYILVISDQRASVSAPNDLGCWNSNATSLQRNLTRLFNLKSRTTN